MAGARPRRDPDKLAARLVIEVADQVDGRPVNLAAVSLLLIAEFGGGRPAAGKPGHIPWAARWPPAKIEPLFPGAPRTSAFGLARFYLLTLPVTRGQAGGELHDIGYRGVAPPPVRQTKAEGFSDRFMALSSAMDCQGAPGDMGWPHRAMRIPQALGLIPPNGDGARNGAGVLIAHPDTGWNVHDQLDRGSLDLDNQFNTMVLEKDPPRWEDARDATDPKTWLDIFHAHGTATASVLVSQGSVTAPGATAGRGGARTGTSEPGNGNPGVVGVATGARVMPIRCIDSVIMTGDVEVSRAVWWAARRNAHVISMSLGGFPAWHLESIIAHAVYEKNMIVCAAAGNLSPVVAFPAAFPDCIAVAGTTYEDAPWPGSTSGDSVELSAPAECVWVADFDEANTQIVRPGSGTSFATPHVAGVAALWLAFHGRDRLVAKYAGRRSLQEVFRDLVTATARNPAAKGGWWNDGYGHGIVDAEALLQAPLPDAAQYPPQDFLTWARLSGLELFRLTFESLDPLILAERLSSLLHVAQSELDAMLDSLGHELMRVVLGSAGAAEKLMDTAVGTAQDAANGVLGAVEDAGAEISRTLRNIIG